MAISSTSRNGIPFNNLIIKIEAHWTSRNPKLLEDKAIDAVLLTNGYHHQTANKIGLNV
jgi:hypothetical protein